MPHHTERPDREGQQLLSRRRVLLGLGIGLADIIALDAMFIAAKPYVVSAWEWLKKQGDRTQVIWAREATCNAPIETVYSTEALQRTYTIASGDSIGEGYYKKGRPDVSAAQYATEAVNSNVTLHRLNPPPNWEHYTVAREGSRIEDVQQQLQDETVVQSLRKEQNIDWWLSVGGNDIVHALASKATRLKRITDNPFTPDFFAVDDELLTAIARYQIGFLGLLRQIAALNTGGNIQRLVIEGLPNLGNADRIDYVSRNGKVVESYPLNKELLGKFFATNLSILVNNAMKESINQLLTENPHMDILFLDTFHMLPPADLYGEHPLPAGQQTMAANFFSMAYHAGQNLGRLLFPHFRNEPTAYQRRATQNPWVIQLPTAA